MQVGVDVIDIEELSNLSKKSWFIHYAFSCEEMALCDGLGPSRRKEFITSRFSGKEAIYKSLGDNNRKLGFWPAKIVIDKGKDGAPVVSLKHPYRVNDEHSISLSIAHKKNICISVAINKGADSDE